MLLHKTAPCLHMARFLLPLDTLYLCTVKPLVSIDDYQATDNKKEKNY
ncbi:hypothetical protein HMPREF1594_04027 [Escherichia coli 907446]|nr:hypothetical protein HMPREF1594_04027 [Escherichia coli 907446]